MLKLLFESTKNSLLSAPKPLLETPIDAIDQFTSVLEWDPLPSGYPLVQWEVSWQGRVCYGRSSAELQGWWMVAGGHMIIAGDTLNLVVFLSSTPTHGHTIVTYTLIDNRTTSTVDTTGTTIELFNHTTQSEGSTKEPTNFLIYTACCCSASNLTFHDFTACRFVS